MSTTSASFVEVTSDKHDDPAEYTNAMMYGYGTAAVAIISLLSLGGIALFPTLGSKSYKLVLQFLIGLAVGTMTADALLHIIPSVLGVHDHEGEHEDDHEEHEDDHEESESEYSTLVWKMSVVFGGIYIFFLFENGLKCWKRNRRIDADPSPTQKSSADDNSTNIVASFEKKSSIPEVLENVDQLEGIPDLASSQEMLQRNDVVCCNFTTVLLTVFIGDVLHNFADGLAIGVSFANSWTTGVGTSIAVLCHEIPHEFGDFAIYLNNGASKWRAIGLNVGAALCAFVGLYGGIALGNEDSLRSWLLAAVAGMFLYIALVQVANEMVCEETRKPVLQFFLQNFGLLLGWSLMLLIALYEEDIQHSISE